MDIFGHMILPANPYGIYSFIALAVLFLLYFLKPKPFQKIIPSLMFLEGSNKKTNVAAFFKRFIKDWLFIFQFLVLLLLCLAAMQLYTDIQSSVKSEEVVIVLDASASSKVQDRFDTYVGLAKDNLGLKNSVILIGASPRIVAKSVNSNEAKSILGRLDPTDSTSNIWDAMVLAGDISENVDSKIIVLSDFIDTNGRDITTLRDVLVSKGHEVILFQDSTADSNIGIISYRLDSSSASLEVRNFGSNPVEFDLDGPRILQPRAVETFTVELKQGLQEIRIDVDDGLDSDNVLYLNVPPVQKARVLIITNSPYQTYMQKALTSMKDIEIDFSNPPVVPDLDYDIIIIDQVDTGKLLKATVDDIRSKVRAGSSLVVMMQDDFYKLDIISPVIVLDILESDSPVLNTNEIEDMSDLDFGHSTKTIQSKLSNQEAIAIADLLTGDPIIAFMREEEGQVMFYGIYDERNSFRFTPDYPLFWIRVIERLSSKDTVELLNLKVGDTIYGDVTAPDGRKFEGYALADMVGFYRGQTKDIAVNLLDAYESDVNIQVQSEEFIQEIKKATADVRFDLTPFLIILSLAAIILEIYFIKRRGDL